MSRQKWTLTQAEQTEYRKRVERLRAAGADLDASSFESADRDWIKITHDRLSYVRALPTGSLFLIPARIVGLAPKVIIQGFELSSPAMDLGAWFLEDPTVNRSDSRLYRFRDGTDFDRNEVLNHRVDAQGTLRYGDVMEGMLLAESFDAIPSRFVDKSFIPICLSIINQFDHVHESMIELRVERTAGRIQPRPPRRSSLFEREDGLPGGPGFVGDAADGVSLHNGRPESLKLAERATRIAGHKPAAPSPLTAKRAGSGLRADR